MIVFSLQQFSLSFCGFVMDKLSESDKGTSDFLKSIQGCVDAFALKGTDGILGITVFSFNFLCLFYFAKQFVLRLDSASNFRPAKETFLEAAVSIYLRSFIFIGLQPVLLEYSTV
jgi:hypothetical protein